MTTIIDKIEKQLEKAEREYEKAEAKLEKWLEKWEEKIQKLEDKLDDGKARNEEQRRGWESQKDRFIKEKEELKKEKNDWGEQYKKLQNDLVDLAKGEVEKRKAEEEHVDGIERGKKLSTAPSSLGKALDYIQVQKQKLFYNGYPLSLQPPPLVLYHPVFANFIDDCKTIELEFDSHIIVTEFVEAMTDTYHVEGERRDKFRELINSYLGFTLNLGSITTNGITYSTDGCVFQEDNIPVILEVKNDNEGNAFKQACGYYWKWIQGLKGNYARITRLPCLLLCLTASHLRIAGAFYNGNYLIESLTEISLDCFESTEPERTQTIGRMLLALKKAVQSLKDYYTSPIQTIPLKFPYITSFKLLDSVYEIPFEYEKKLNEGKFVYVVKTGTSNCNDVPKLLVIKFVTNYGLDMHKFCANKNIAPKVYGYENINCDWKMVTMEYFSDYKLLTDPPLETDKKIKLQKKIKDAVQEMHNEGLVHGDLRECNILYKEEVAEKNRDGNIQVRIIDFDWGGKEEAVRYPPRLNPCIPWPLGVQINKQIKQIHDSDLLQSTIEKYLKV